MSDHVKPFDAPAGPDDSAAKEHRFHSYIGNRIPWYVRLIWLLFWVGATYYVIAYLLPALQIEIVNPP
jgi:hypothetical protein